MRKQIATLCALVSLATPVSSEAILDWADSEGSYTGDFWNDKLLKITIKKGQTLIGIAEQYLGDRRAYLWIAKINGIEGPQYKIYAGQELRLP